MRKSRSQIKTGKEAALSAVAALHVVSSAAPLQAVAEDSRNQPIPLMLHAATALDYHAIPIRLDSAEAAEPLIDVTTVGIAAQSYYARRDGLNAPYDRCFGSATERVWSRKSVCEKLADANKLLRPYGVELLVLDGFRPIELQRELWDHFVGQAQVTLKNPTAEQCARFAGQFCSDPRGYKEDDFRTWPTHNTGGAVDVTLRALSTGEPLYMGGVFDDASEVSHTDWYERGTGPVNSASFAEARRNRRLLYWAMTSVGFANYSYEWWHFDYLTQMWSMNRGKSEVARYGRAVLPRS